MDNQQNPTVQHRELCLVLCGSLDGRGVWGRMDTCVCLAESLRCLPETITALLMGHERESVSAQSSGALCDPIDSWPTCQDPLSMGFPRQEHWSGLAFISPKDLPNPGIKPTSPAFQVNSAT